MSRIYTNLAWAVQADRSVGQRPLPDLPRLTKPYTFIKNNVSQREREREIEWGHKEGGERKWKLPFLENKHVWVK